MTPGTALKRVARRPGHPVAHDFADRAGRRNLRRRPAGQRRQLRQPVDHPLLRLLIGEVVGELHLDVRQAEQRNRADRRDIRDAGHLDLDRDGHVAFHLLGRGTRALHDDIDQRRHRIGICLDIQVHEGDRPANEHPDEHHDDQDALAQRRGDHFIHSKTSSLS